MQQTFDGIRDIEWDRFHLYAGCVKHFNFHSPCPFEQLSERWLSFLLRKSARTSLFPALQTLNCSYEARGAIRLLPVTFRSQLEQLSLAVRSAARTHNPYAIPNDWESGKHDFIDADPMAGLMADVNSFASELRSLIYRGPVTTTVMRSLSGLVQLTELTITITSYNDVNDVYSLNNLKHLQMLKMHVLSSWGPNKLGSASVKRPPPRSLPSLLRLDVVATAWTMMTLAWVIAPTNLQVFRHEVVDLQYGKAYLSRLACFLGCNQDLQHICIAMSDRPGSSEELSSQETFLMLLSPLLQQGSLVDLSVMGLPLNGASLHEMYRVCLEGKDLSRLKTFRCVPQGDGVPRQCYATPETLQDLALKGCKSLETLELRFRDFQTMPPIPVQRSTHSLRELRIVTEASNLSYTLSEKVSIAMFLDSLFPSLSLVSGSASALWEDINTLIESYQLNRRYHSTPP